MAVVAYSPVARGGVERDKVLAKIGCARQDGGAGGAALPGAAGHRRHRAPAASSGWRKISRSSTSLSARPRWRRSPARPSRRPHRRLRLFRLAQMGLRSDRHATGSKLPRLIACAALLALLPIGAAVPDRRCRGRDLWRRHLRTSRPASFSRSRPRCRRRSASLPSARASRRFGLDIVYLHPPGRRPGQPLATSSCIRPKVRRARPRRWRRGRRKIRPSAA